MFHQKLMEGLPGARPGVPTLLKEAHSFEGN